jgi:beta-lactamase class A
MGTRNIWVRRAVSAGIVAVLMASSYLVGWHRDNPNDKALKDERSAYNLLAPRLFLDNPNDSIVSFSSLRADIEAYLAQTVSTPASLYFEYLPTGTSIQIGEKNELVAASLMKIPLALNLMRSGELGKIGLDKKMPLKKEWLNDQFGTLYRKGEGYQLTLREAVRLMLKDSDNTAALMIQDALAASPLSEQQDSIYSLDVQVDLSQDKRALVSALAYGSFLKCLYFSCYLTKADSQELLQYLTESSFDDRLEGKLPDGVEVAHKIGTFGNRAQSDCGIVYVERRDYILCVMIDQSDAEASAHIADISKKVYDYVTNLKIPQ